MSVASEIVRFTDELPANVRLVAVSKFHPVEKLMEAYSAGQRIFGESRVQELVQKAQEMPADVQWHFIGHLQTNKVRALLPHVSLIHSVDSERLLDCIDREAERIGRAVDVLLQIHVAQEEAKFGFTLQEITQLANSGKLTAMSHVRVVGVMAMATNTDDDAEIRREFAEAHHVFYTLKDGCFFGDEHFCELSMGMSDDYRLAIAEGSTMVRIGTTIFGAREY
ncbi:MAG: YggS family pyridoxal phosphate-dependent enzyme [bacterium]|nr:YggS family pyridoxal phosphate-dependent enzyme [bacterium]MDD6027180.1 YggS family pyridoxal phosphate-dependent enzyme [bacterium]